MIILMSNDNDMKIEWISNENINDINENDNN